jgi:hypothetical protein
MHKHYHRTIGQYLHETRAINRASFVPLSWGDEQRLAAGWNLPDSFRPTNSPPELRVQNPYLIPPSNF